VADLKKSPGPVTLKKMIFRTGPDFLMLDSFGAISFPVIYRKNRFFMVVSIIRHPAKGL
jgi:hypothetical protein